MLPDTQEFISCLLREREQGKEQKRSVGLNLKECGVKGKKQGHCKFVFFGGVDYRQKKIVLEDKLSQQDDH